jgi:hypothetical protein
MYIYEDRLQSSWTHLITPSRNFVEVRWRSFFKYLPWQAVYLLQRSTPFSKTCCRPLITSKFLASELLFMVGKVQKSHGARSELNYVFGLEKVDRWNPIKHPPYSPDLVPCDFLAFPTIKRELRGKKFRSDQRSTARFREVGGAL